MYEPPDPFLPVKNRTPVQLIFLFLPHFALYKERTVLYCTSLILHLVLVVVVFVIESHSNYGPLWLAHGFRIIIPKGKATRTRSWSSALSSSKGILFPLLSSNIKCILLICINWIFRPSHKLSLISFFSSQFFLSALENWHFACATTQLSLPCSYGAFPPKTNSDSLDRRTDTQTSRLHGSIFFFNSYSPQQRQHAVAAVS